MRPARLVPWLLIASLASQAARAAPPDPLDFPARAAALEAAADPDALVQAASLRRALGQPELAAADTERFFARLAADPRSATAAADAYLDELADPALYPEPVAREAALRRFLSLVSAPAASSALLAARTRAEVLLASQLWDQSCPLPSEKRSDAACIERIDARAESFRNSLKQKALRKLGRLPEAELDPCSEPARARYIVHLRRPGPAREARALLIRALGRARPEPPSVAFKDTLAQARFLLTEPRFEAALARPVPLGLDFDPRSPRRMRDAKARFSAWLTARTRPSPLRPAEAPLYAAAEFADSPVWALAAQVRLGQLFLDLDDNMHTPQVYHPPPPPSGYSAAERRSSVRENFCCGFGESLWLDEAQKLLRACTATAARLSLYTPFVRSGYEILSQIDDSVFDKAEEIRPTPTTQTALLTRIEPGGSAP